MGARRLPLTALPRRELLTAALAALATALLAYAGAHKFGTPGLLVPLAVLLALALLSRPLIAVSLVTVVVIVCEGPSFGLFTSLSKIYEVHFKDIDLLDGLVALAVASVGLELVRTRRRLQVPRPLIVPYVLLALAMIAGVVVGHAAGASLRFAVSSEHVLFYLLLLPLAVANLELDRRKLMWLLGCLVALAGVKALAGLAEVALHRGTSIEGVATLTYYEPTANWLIMIAVLSIAAAVLARARAPRWVLLTSPLLIACLVLSYRRSFWIGAVLGLLLVLMLGTTPVGRRLLVPTSLAVAAAIWLLGSLHFQNSVPIVKRAASLNPSSLEASAEDRYRLDERANVLAEIKKHPVSGLGVTIPWAATAQTLSLEEGAGEGRQYVHFAALWFWLKLGVLGLLAYVGVMLGSMWLAWQAWRVSPEPLMRAFALASGAAMVGLVVIDTTASFTGVDPRFTVLFAAQIGLLALIVKTAPSAPVHAPMLSAPPPPLRAPTARAAR
jgi:O-antigen ligase/polysaccharide polymerase Wzy-like membrane protein